MLMSALEGIRVVELTQIMAGPFCGMLLADLGAEVIKIENPRGGDDSRRMAPPYYNGESAAFVAVNRNKYGIALDIRTPQGSELLWRLIETADVLVENFRPGTMERLGFGYEQVHVKQPRLIYCSISGFGHTGPYADRGGFDLVAQAMSGMLSITGSPQEPAKVGVPISDLNAGLFASHAILAAPYQVFTTTNGWIAIGAANQRNWERLVQALDRSDLLHNPLFATNSDRMAHLLVLVETLTETLKTRTTEEWLPLLEQSAVPCGPVLALDQVYQHPQVEARNMDIEIEHPIAGRVHAIGCPVKYSATPPQIYRPAPILGQHTFQVLESLGISPEKCHHLET